VLEMRLYSPHKCDFICKREDGTHYLYVKCDWTGYYEVHREGNQWICGEKIDDPN
jgi:hypothetical protein